MYRPCSMEQNPDHAHDERTSPIKSLWPTGENLFHGTLAARWTLRWLYFRGKFSLIKFARYSVFFQVAKLFTQRPTATAVPWNTAPRPFSLFRPKFPRPPKPCSMEPKSGLFHGTKTRRQGGHGITMAGTELGRPAEQSASTAGLDQ